MTTTTDLDAGALAELFAASDDHDVMHQTLWCDEDTALCGVDLTGEPWVPEGAPAPDLACPECVAIERAGNRAHVMSCAVCMGVDADEDVIWLDPPN